MVHTKNAEEYTKRRIFKSMQTFLEGTQTLNWIMGVIEDQKSVALDILRNRLSEYGDTARREELRRELESGA